MANGAKPRSRTQRINQATTPSATTKETTKPIASTIQLCGVMLSGARPASAAASCRGRIVFNKSYPVATTIVGMERKNENSSAAARVNPAVCPAAIVDIDREVPGKTADKICTAPIQTACGKLISSMSVVLG